MGGRYSVSLVWPGGSRRNCLQLCNAQLMNQPTMGSVMHFHFHRRYTQDRDYEIEQAKGQTDRLWLIGFSHFVQPGDDELACAARHSLERLDA